MGLELSIEILSDLRWSFAYAGTRRPIIKGIIVHQSGALLDEDTEIYPRVTFNFPLPEPLAPQWEGIKRILTAKGREIGESISWERITPTLNYPLLGRLREKVSGQIVVEIINARTDEVVATEIKQYELLAPNEWQHESNFDEVLAAFVLPSDPFVSEILIKARKLLQERTGNSSTEGYQAETFHHPNDSTSFSDHSRAYKIANAIYDAMSDQKYSYSNPQGHFDDTSQNVRTPSQIKSESAATCLDSAVLMAACFAQAGLEPVLFLIKGHAFTGYFTGRAVTNAVGQLVSGPQGGPAVGGIAVHYWKSKTGSVLKKDGDYALIRQLLNFNHIQAVETTTTTTGSARPFHEACQEQNNFNLKNDAALESIVIVSNAWNAGITPPVNLADVPIIPNPSAHEGLGNLSNTTDGSVFRETTDIALDDIEMTPEERAIPPRIRQWMASLLELGARNPLLKMKPSHGMEFDLPPTILGLIDDLLYTPKKRIELSSPSVLPFEWVHSGVTTGDFEAWITKQTRLVFPSYNELNGIQRSVEHLVKEIRKGVDEPIVNLSKGDTKAVQEIRANSNHEIHRMTDAQLIKRFREGQLASLDGQLTKEVKKLQEKAKEVFLTTGNNSMYLTLGSISWSESTDNRGQSKVTNWSAPLYLYPIILEGGKGSPYSIRLDPNGDATPNFCLHEKLKRAPYNLDLQELVNPATDEKGLDFNKMVLAIEQRLRQAKFDNFSVQPRATIGVFNYSTFRLWKDLKDNWTDMCAISPVVKHLSYSSNVDFVPSHVVPEPKLEPHLPIAADDSQRQAVQWALNGESFRLEGPPGTGKSQTIANLLASCIAVNKKVLFVAEKQTALNAVKERLEASGLGKYTLNLHAKGDSDSKLRKTISDQLTTALNQQIDPENQHWDDIAFRLHNEEQILDLYRASVHDRGNNGLSTWSSHEEVLHIGEGDSVDLPIGFVDSFSEIWPQLREVCAEIQRNLELVVNPNTHMWRFVDHPELSEADLPAITTALNGILSSFADLESISGIEPTLLDRINPSSLGKYATALDMASRGVFPTIDALRVLNESAPFLDEAKRLSNALKNHLNHVSPKIVDRSDLDEIRQLLSELDSIELTIKETLTTWNQLSLDQWKLDSRITFKVFTAAEILTISAEIAKFDSTSESQQFDDLIANTYSLQSRVRQHEHNVAADFLSRTDAVNIGVLLSDAEEAGALTRGRKFKTLRSALGGQAKAIEDRMLVLSLKEMIPLIQESESIKTSLQSKFPEMFTSDFQPWNPLHTNALHDLYRRSRVARLRTISNLVGSIDDDEAFVQSLRSIVQLSERINTLILELGQNFPEVAKNEYQPWVTDEGTRLRSDIRNMKIDKIRTKLGSDALTIDDELLVAALGVWIDSKDSVVELSSSLGTNFLPGYSRPFSPWLEIDVNELANTVQRLIEYRLTLQDQDFEVLEMLLNSSTDGANPSAFITAANNWDNFTDVLQATKEDINLWLNGRTIFETVRVEVPLLLRDAGINHRYLELLRWQSFQKSIAKLAALGFENQAVRVSALETDVTILQTDIRRSAMQQSLRERMLDGNLDRFDRKVHERRIATYEAAMKEAQSLLQTRIPGLVSNRRSIKKSPTGNDVGATNSLLGGLKPIRGEKTPIRDLISKYGNALADAIPCFLMSPDSVATLLPVGAIDFDLVVFDEASQVRTAHAIGALGRGKAGIVVGDSRQMPPSNIFSSNSGAFIDNDGDEDNTEEEDFADLEEDDEVTMIRPVAMADEESILKEYYAAKLPNMQLLCHYRSKDELLISFSNSFIYDEPMLTFPSTKGLESTALSYRVVEGGYFERDKKAPQHTLPNNAGLFPSLRTNIREAVAIVEEVNSRLRDPKRVQRRIDDSDKKVESIIVVTFNVQQKNLITELFRATDGALFEEATKEERISEDSGETYPPQLKIRNLENVQGDEAETVIFSAAFSARPDGKFPLNWGPVTQTGGDRKLNVAVTRAQNEMIVFASFLPEQMIPKDKAARPEAVLLQKFFQLAYKGAATNGDVGVSVTSSRHINAIAQQLRDRGYEVETQMGLSSLRIDLAVKKSKSDDWQLAIMVDDSCWSERGSAFQREVLPRQVLPFLGWKKVLRIWLPSWVHDRQEILEEIDSFFAGNALPEAEPEVVTPSLPPRIVSVVPISTEDISANSNSLFSSFAAFVPETVDAMYLLDQALDGHAESKNYILNIIKTGLQVEGPIEENRLAKLVCKSLNFGRISPERIKQVLSLIPKKQFTKDAVGSFVWAADQDPNTWRNYRTSVNELTRGAQEISSHEFINALEDMVTNQHAVSHENAVREIATVFGFRKLNENARASIESAFKIAIKKGRAQLVEGEYRPIA